MGSRWLPGTRPGALIGPLDPAPVLIGIACGLVFLAFVVALVAAVSGRAGSVLGTGTGSIVILLVMPVAGRSLCRHATG